MSRPRPLRLTTRGRALVGAAAGVVLIAAAIGVAAIIDRGDGGSAAAPATTLRRFTPPISDPTSPPPTSSSSRPTDQKERPPAPATTTTTNPGALPQTKAFPSAVDPAFLARMTDLWRAIATGDADLASSSFFPVSAYVQVKAEYDPAQDWKVRLWANLVRDVTADHATLGTGAAHAHFVGVTVPDAAVWVLPGEEYNRGSYWRVYDAELHYRMGGDDRTFTITSLISWRGEWYLVHLNGFT